MTSTRRALVSYYATVLGRAWKATTWLSWGRALTALIAPTINLYLQWFNGWKALNDMVRLAALSAAIYAAIGALEFIWHAIRTPPKLAEEAAARLAEARAEAANAVAEVQEKLAVIEASTPILTIESAGASTDKAIYLTASLFNPPDGKTISLRDDWAATLYQTDGSEWPATRVGAKQQSGAVGVDALGPGETARLNLSAVYMRGAPRSTALWAKWVVTVTDRQQRPLRAEYRFTR